MYKLYLYRECNDDELCLIRLYQYFIHLILYTNVCIFILLFSIDLCRLCSLTITRLSILTPLPGDTTSLSLAVKMQSSKRTLRSHEIPINGSALTAVASSSSRDGTSSMQGNSPMSNVIGGSGLIGTPGNVGNAGIGTSNVLPLTETELDLHFSLQYPHFIKRDGNR